MTRPERIAAYQAYRMVRCTDPRWQTILEDLRAGVITLHRAPECWLARIEICT
jgi:hypothetical protein